MLIVNNSFELELFKTDIEKSELENITDALECEIKFNDFDFEL